MLQAINWNAFVHMRIYLLTLLFTLSQKDFSLFPLMLVRVQDCSSFLPLVSSLLFPLNWRFVG